MGKKEFVTIHEITLRDGLQNIKKFIPTDNKIKLLNLLLEAGAINIECTSFVSPRWVPQMADAKELIQRIGQINHIRKFVLIPNMKGYDLAFASGIKEMVTFISASEIHNQNNINRTVKESLEELKAIGKRAEQDGVTVRANIATAFGYQQEEYISTDKIFSIAEVLHEAGYKGITLCDTTGVANPDQVYSLIRLLIKQFSKDVIAIHLHQCEGIEFANAFAAYSAGIRIFESAAGGLGGCPYAFGANGNIPTELLVRMFNSMNVDCGINLEKIYNAADYAKKLQLAYSK